MMMTRGERAVDLSWFSNMQEVRARGGKIVLISDAQGLVEAGEGCIATIEMPKRFTR